MFKKLVFLTGITLGFAGTSPAAVLDSPDTVYIDGQPCGSFCQAYMAWSRGYALPSPAPAPEGRPAQPAAHHPPRHLHGARSGRLTDAPAATQTRISRQRHSPSVNLSQQVRTAPKANALPKTNEDLPNAGTSSAKPNASSTTTTYPGPSVAKAVSDSMSVQQLVAAATMVAEQQTATETVVEHKTMDPSAPAHLERSAAETTASIPTNDRLVAIVLARLETKSVSDLGAKDVAIDEKQSASGGSVRTAIAAAGAVEVQLSNTQTKAIDRVISGEVPAGVLALVSQEAADAFPEITGFRIFRIPLSPR
jgi:hypothetical protein